MVRAVDDVRPNAYFTDMVKSGLEDDAKRREEANFPLVIHEPGDKVTNDNGSIEVKNTPYTVKPVDLLDLNVWEKYTTKHGNERELKGTVVEQVDDRSYRVEFAMVSRRSMSMRTLSTKSTTKRKMVQNYGSLMIS